MQIRAVLVAALAAAGAVPAGPAGAQDRAEREFSSVWIVAASDQPIGARSVNDGELVFRNRLLPPALIRLRVDAVDRESGRVVAAAGTQLFGLLTAGAPIYCVVGRREPSVMVRILWHGGNRQICLIDLDRDNVLDAHFRAGNAVMGVPNFRGRRPRDPDRLTGSAYEELSPAEIAVEYFVAVRYDGKIGLLANPTPVFSIVFGSDRSEERLTQQIRPVRQTVPPLVRTLDAEFVVTGLRGDTIDIEVRRNVPAQPFNVVRTVTYY